MMSYQVYDSEWPAGEYRLPVQHNGVSYRWPYVPDSIHCMDALELAGMLPDESVDMILADLPYGTTECEWDKRIPLEPMWEAFRRIIKPRGAIVLTATEPFASMLRMGWMEGYKYDWVWVKNASTFFVHAKNRPMLRHENVLVFSSGVVLHQGQSERRMDYYPQMRKGKYYKKVDRSLLGHTATVGPRPSHKLNYTRESSYRYPDTILKFDMQCYVRVSHPTQKPVALFEYLIKTYTQPGEVVFDPVVGSGTTAVAAKQTGRRYIVGDMLAKYAEMTRRRLHPIFGQPAMRERAVLPLGDLPLFKGVGD
jgi:site-specific DNA-methyltransferase (adenine-specific)